MSIDGIYTDQPSDVNRSYIYIDQPSDVSTLQ